VLHDKHEDAREPKVIITKLSSSSLDEKEGNRVLLAAEFSEMGTTIGGSIQASMSNSNQVPTHVKDDSTVRTTFTHSAEWYTDRIVTEQRLIKCKRVHEARSIGQRALTALIKFEELQAGYKRARFFQGKFRC
jgi:hypothetical protein